MQANKHDYQYKWWVNHELNFEVASFPILQIILFIFFPTTWTVYKNRIYLFVCFFIYLFVYCSTVDWTRARQAFYHWTTLLGLSSPSSSFSSSSLEIESHSVSQVELEIALSPCRHLIFKTSASASWIGGDPTACTVLSHQAYEFSQFPGWTKRWVSESVHGDRSGYWS